MGQGAARNVIDADIGQGGDIFFGYVAGTFRFSPAGDEATASFIMSWLMLSSMMMSAPASTASRTMSSVSVSTSILRTKGA